MYNPTFLIDFGYCKKIVQISNRTNEYFMNTLNRLNLKKCSSSLYENVMNGCFVIFFTEKTKQRVLLTFPKIYRVNIFTQRVIIGFSILDYYSVISDRCVINL